MAIEAIGGRFAEKKKLYRDVEARAFDRSRLKMFENHLFAFPYYFSINSKTDEEKNAILGTSFSYL
mgnify:CR=1 FL=1